jgi:glucose/arabinose dehydrogenase
MVTEVVAGLNAPTAMAFIGPGDILVLQKNDGQVRRDRRCAAADTSLDVAVNQLSERGLLGMALHPTFQSTAWVYLYYTESSTGNDTQSPSESHGNRLYRYRWDERLVEPQLILDLPVTLAESRRRGPHRSRWQTLRPDWRPQPPWSTAECLAGPGPTIHRSLSD